MFTGYVNNYSLSDIYIDSKYPKSSFSVSVGLPVLILVCLSVCLSICLSVFPYTPVCSYVNLSE